MAGPGIGISLRKPYILINYPSNRISQPKKVGQPSNRKTKPENKWDLINYPSNRESQPKNKYRFIVTVKCSVGFELINYNREMLSRFGNI